MSTHALDVQDILQPEVHPPLGVINVNVKGYWRSGAEFIVFARVAGCEWMRDDPEQSSEDLEGRDYPEQDPGEPDEDDYFLNVYLTSRQTIAITDKEAGEEFLEALASWHDEVAGISDAPESPTEST